MQKRRLIPDLVLFSLWFGALGWVWLGQDAIRQQKVLQSIGSTLLLLLLLLLRFVFLSRLGWRARLGGLAAAIAAVALMAGLFEIRGVTGDLVPLLALRWQPEAGEIRDDLPDLPPPSAAPLATRAGPAQEEDEIAEPPPTNAAEIELTAQEEPAAAAAENDAPPPAEPTASEPSAPPVQPGAAEPAPAPAEAARVPDPSSADFPQFLGPRRDGTLPELELARDWQAAPPRLLWRHGIGAGWSGFSVVGDALLTQEQRGADELVVRYDLATGEPVWVHREEARYDSVIGGIGPRATPTISGGAVYAMGATGVLTALDLESGRLLWRHDLTAEMNAAVPEWGKSCSPLVAGDRVVVSAGALVAFDRRTGERLWAAGDDDSSYSSPFLATLAGREQVVIFNRRSVMGHDPEDGRILWRFPWSYAQPNVSQPVVLGPDRLFVSSGYGIGGKVLEIAASDGELEASLVWESPRLKAKFTNVVLHGGYLYGLDDGILVCLDPATGERCWKRGRYGHGQVLLVGDLLLVQTEGGEIVLVEPRPDEHRELARFTAFDGKTWNPPALAGNKLLVRNHKEMACYEMPLGS